MDVLEQQVKESLVSIAQAPSIAELENLRVGLLGKSGLVTEQLKALGKLLTAAGDALGLASSQQQAIHCVVSFGTFPTVASCPILPLLVETQIKLCDLLLAEELLKTVSVSF